MQDDMEQFSGEVFDETEELSTVLPVKAEVLSASQRYMPQLTRRDEMSGRVEGCYDARERWLWICGNRATDHGIDTRKLWSKAQQAMDLEGEGLSFDDLGALSEETLALPRDPDYKAEKRITVPKNPHLKQAHVQGMTNRLISLNDKLAEVGLSLDSERDEVPPEHMELFMWAQHERLRVAERLEAFGEDADKIDRSVIDGEALYQSEAERPEVIAEDPEMRRIQAEHRAECAGLDYSEQVRIGQQAYKQALREQNQNKPWPIRGLAGAFSREGYLGADKDFENAAREVSSLIRYSEYGPRREMKEAKLALIKERLGQLQEQLEDLGYSRDTNLDNVASCHEEIVGRILIERERIAEDLGALCESIGDVDAQVDEDSMVHNLDEKEKAYEKHELRDEKPEQEPPRRDDVQEDSPEDEDDGEESEEQDSGGEGRDGEDDEGGDDDEGGQEDESAEGGEDAGEKAWGDAASWEAGEDGWDATDGGFEAGEW